MSILHCLLRKGNGFERVRELLRAGEDPNDRNNDGDSALHFVAYRNEANPNELEEYLQVAIELIRYGADVNARNDMGVTPLIIAVRTLNCRMADFLLQINAGINMRDNYGNAALHHATCQCGSSARDSVLQLVKILLRFNPELNIKNILDQTPLMLAVKNQDFRVVQELLKKNASVNLTDAYNESAMHHALDQAHVNVNIVVELARHGCKFNISNLYDETPMSLYIRRLLIASACELEEAKYVFKLFLFHKNTFSLFETRAIERISRLKNCQLSQFIGYCKNEVSQMQRDKLAPDYYIYNMALRGFYYQVVDNYHLPFEAFDKVLDKLMKSVYPLYCDMIVSGICCPFLNKKFAEACCGVACTGRYFLNFDEMYLLSFYLSHFDMLNMMIACSPDNKHCKTFPWLERFQRYRKCSVL